jgi:hypothetical protein
MQLNRYGSPSTHPTGLRQQERTSMNVYTLNNPHAREKCNEKKAFDQVIKPKFKWDELQTQVQQMQELWRPCWYV